MNEPGALAWANVAGFAFPLGAMVAVDLTQYPVEADHPEMIMDRKITLHLSHTVSHIFIGEDSDEFFKWWTELSTPKHVQGVQGVIRPA